ncbi:MAG: NYN domain-containing protein, partial [bacterium]
MAQNQTKNPNAAKHKEQRVAVFVDVQNMYYSAKNLYGAKVDFAKVLKEGVAGRKLVRAFAYVIKADVGAEKEFHEALSLQGFEVRIKELQVFFGGAKKGDWDVGLCMDTVRMMPKIDVMVLVSGDGDYVDLIEYARSQGVRTEVVAFDKTASGKLVEMVDAFTNMGEDHKKFLIGQRMFIPKPPRSANQSQDNSTPSI